jgi:hypothetical protein
MVQSFDSNSLVLMQRIGMDVRVVGMRHPTERLDYHRAEPSR